MARKSIECKIINIEADPIHPGRTIVSLELNDGKMDGPYVRGFSVITPEGPISLEKFALDLSNMDLSRPKDPFFYLKESKEKGELFTVYPQEKDAPDS